MLLSEFAIELQLYCVLYVGRCLSIGIILFYILQYIFIRFIHLIPITELLNILGSQNKKDEKEIFDKKGNNFSKTPLWTFCSLLQGANAHQKY